MKALDELNILVINAAIFCDNKAAIDIAVNYKIDNQGKYIDITDHLVYENVESAQISLVQVESAKNLDNICTQ
jgi:hypothetical protein